VVWEARHVVSGQAVALKLLEADISDPDAMRRFERERDVMTALAPTRGILGIVDAGVEGGKPWLAMKLCRRGSLAGYLSAGGALDLATGLRVLDRLAEALGVAHQHGIVHCDIKPANIMITDAGEAALGDFGIARVSVGRATTTTVGGFSLDHIAPELLEDGKRSAQSDIYSLGTTTWELLAGHPPFRGTDDVSVGAVLTRILHQPLPESPHIPADVLTLLRTMAAKSPDARPASMSDVADHVQALSNARQVHLGQPPFGAMSPAEIEVRDSLAGAVELDVAAAATRYRSAATQARPSASTFATVRRRLPLVAASAVGVLLVAAAAVGVMQMTAPPMGSPQPVAQGVPETLAASTTTIATTIARPPSPMPTTAAAEALAPPVAPPQVRAVQVPAAPAPGQPPAVEPPDEPSQPDTPPPVTTRVSTPIPGDVNKNGKVGCSDLNAVRASFGATGSGLSADVNHDGTVNATDLSIVLSHWTTNESSDDCGPAARPTTGTNGQTGFGLLG
jgi:hypothetical protein